MFIAGEKIARLLASGYLEAGRCLIVTPNCEIGNVFITLFAAASTSNALVFLGMISPFLMVKFCCCFLNAESLSLG